LVRLAPEPLKALAVMVVVLLISLPVMLPSVICAEPTALRVAKLPRPLTSVLGIAAAALNALVPEPLT
jgi:hypothetical protein